MTYGVSRSLHHEMRTSNNAYAMNEFTFGIILLKLDGMRNSSMLHDLMALKGSSAASQLPSFASNAFPNQRDTGVNLPNSGKIRKALQKLGMTNTLATSATKKAAGLRNWPI